MSGSSEIAPPPPVFPATLFTPTPKAARRVLEFFTAHMSRNRFPPRKMRLSPFAFCYSVNR